MSKAYLAVNPAEPLADLADEAFCQAAVSRPWASKTDWFRAARPDIEPDPGDKRNAWFMARKPAVIARIAHLQLAESNRGTIGRDGLRRFLEGVIMTPVGELSEDSPLTQEVHYHENGQIAKVKGPDKMRAAEMLAKLNGWDRPDGEAGPVIEAQLVVMAVLSGKFKTQQ